MTRWQKKRERGGAKGKIQGGAYFLMEREAGGANALQITWPNSERGWTLEEARKRAKDKYVGLPCYHRDEHERFVSVREVFVNKKYCCLERVYICALSLLPFSFSKLFRFSARCVTCELTSLAILCWCSICCYYWKFPLSSCHFVNNLKKHNIGLLQ